MKRLDKLLSNMGKGSRSEITKLIRSGKATVNGKVIKDPSFKANEEKDEVCLNGESVLYKEHFFIMLNKPQGYVTATEDNFNKTVLDLIDDPLLKKRVAPAGRLDIDTEGFVFLTSDGDLNHFITGPKSHVRKRYLIHSREFISDEDIERLEKGVTLDDGYVTKEARVIRESEKVYYMDLHEGKFHQVKRMLKAVGNEVMYLKRIMIGNLMLDENLALGEYREITDYEKELLKGKEE